MVATRVFAQKNASKAKHSRFQSSPISPISINFFFVGKNKLSYMAHWT